MNHRLAWRLDYVLRHEHDLMRCVCVHGYGFTCETVQPTTYTARPTTYSIYTETIGPMTVKS